jgi:hypothetical protein
VLAGLRVAVNAEQRQPDRDSGPTKNALNDLVGALAELVALRVLEEAGAEKLTHHLLDLSRPCDGVTSREATAGGLVLDHLWQAIKPSCGHRHPGASSHAW